MTDPLRDLPSPELASDELRATVLGVHGAVGAAWLETLPALLEDCSRRWHLKIQPPFAGLFYNFVTPALDANGRPVVLKLGVACRELTTEIEALRIFDGRGAVQLVASDRERGALLLERLLPGTPLVGSGPAADEVTAGVFRRLWRPAPKEHGFPTVADWARGFDRLRARFGGRAGPLPEPWVGRAESMFGQLLADSGPDDVLLHGDLHHGNILAAEREPWLAIDPKGLVGPAAYDAAVFLRSVARGQGGEVPTADQLAVYVCDLADALGFEPARLRDWAVAQAVLSAWWRVEDNEDGWEQEIAAAERFASLPSMAG